MENNFYVVQSKDNKLIRNSSSGGVFAELARYVLSKDGVVFGCAIERVEEGFDVKHIYIENEKDLYKLQGSKYVQSNLGNTIKQAKEFLEQGRFVLFSGTPCQIAGLKAYLKQDYKNLITIDLSCTGTPSLNIFNDYIKFLEKKYKQKIVNFEFRNKEKFGWSCGSALITFKGGKQKVLYNNISSYFNLFLNKKLQKESCQNCKFAGLERVSDITVADAWGVENEYPELLKTKFDKNKGISLVLINTSKGFHILNSLKEELITSNIEVACMQKYNNPLNKIIINNFDNSYINEYKNSGYIGIEKLFRKNLGNKYYYYIIKNHTPQCIKNIIKLFLRKQEKVDCLLYTMYAHQNYGSLLTAYALQKVFEKLGYSSKLISYSNTYGYNKNFISKNLKTTRRYFNTLELQKLNNKTEIFVLGSDNLINLKDGELKFVTQSLLNFTSPPKKRIMISGSIGAWDGSTRNKDEHDYLKYLLDRFDYVSTREEYGKQVFENVFDVKADWINDPVFYLEKQDFIDLIKDVKQDYSDNIMQYILYPTDKTQEIVEYYQNKTGLNTVKFDGNEHVKYFSRHKNQFVENWLSAILNSKLVITDSFHCVAFSLIFNRPFVCIKNTHATVRFTSLFKRLGIDIPLIESIKDLKTKNLDYNKEQVNKHLEDIRNYALNKIMQAMQVPKKEYSIDERMEEYSKKFMKNNIPWYKKSKLFYFVIIVPFVIPIKRLMADLENEYNRKNK